MNLHSSNTTAILVFARSSNEELRHKKIARGNQLFDALTEHTLKTVEKTGVPFFHISEEEQKGSSFGVRFANAMQHVFGQGYKNIITIGNDSPHLTKTHILNAVSQLENGKSVIGPSADGGFYLMGLHNTDFKKSDFESLSWQTSELKDEIVRLLSSSGQDAFLLPTLFDIDTFWDVKIIDRNISGLSQGVLKAIRSIVSSTKKIALSSFFFASEFHSAIPHNKGSPFLFIS